MGHGPDALAEDGGPPPQEPNGRDHAAAAPAHFVLIALGTIAFLYVGRPVVLPVFLAWMAATTLRPVVALLTRLRLPMAFSAAVVFCMLVGAIGAGFLELERPAARWINEAPERMTELRQRVQRIFPKAQHLSQATAAVSDLGATEAEKKEEHSKIPIVEVKDERGASSILNWTGTLLAGLGEVLVLTYLLLASGDLFLQKLVRVIPTLRGKIRAVEITREIEDNISNYLFSVSLINVGLGVAVSLGLFALGVPNATMWGILAALLNFVPYFGSIAGVVILAAVGLLTFDSPWRGLLPALWFMALHLLEANLVTPILLGRRFTLNPVAIFVSLIFWIWLWGVSGALLSVPILVSVKVVCDRIPSMAHFGEMIGR
jgi:predicted PurR-regulated permease PerM